MSTGNCLAVKHGTTKDNMFSLAGIALVDTCGKSFFSFHDNKYWNLDLFSSNAIYKFMQNLKSHTPKLLFSLYANGI